jgi:hypothetical protein
MIRTGKTSDFGNDFISLDLSDKQHKNRVIDFFERESGIPGEMEYTIRAQWTAAQYHPYMRMDADEFVEFVEALSVWAERIKSRPA